MKCDLDGTAGCPPDVACCPKIASLSQVSVKHNAAEFEKSLLMLVRRSSSLVLFVRNWTFTR